MRLAWRRLRGGIGMGLCWAAGWALTGLILGVSSRLLPGLPWERLFVVFDAPLPALAVPGFVGGLLFSVVLAVAARGHRLDGLSLPRMAAWGALAGLLLSLVPGALAGIGLLRMTRPDDGWRLFAAMAPPLVVLGAGSAAASLLLARRAESERPLRPPLAEAALPTPGEASHPAPTAR
ncbi:MAG: hypothetical protein NW201_06135 [Gemmatimonadales bacterium]|nr:hypothetical protein [Gemmatimonadales bacterium]